VDGEEFAGFLIVPAAGQLDIDFSAAAEILRPFRFVMLPFLAEFPHHVSGERFKYISVIARRSWPKRRWRAG
jgi:hypothetical protein